METDFEKLLKKVAVPVTRPRFWIWKKIYFSRIVILIIVIFVGIIVISGVVGNEAIKIQKNNDLSFDNDLVKKVSELMVLPDEKPIIATVTDLGKLKGNMFFKDAANGNKLLMFQKANRAILYNQDKHQLINFGKVEEVGVDLNF